VNPKRTLERLVRRLAELVDRYRESERDTDIALSAMLGVPDAMAGIRYPVAHVNFLRACIEASVHDVQEVKAEAGPPENAANRFAILMDCLRTGLPAIDFSVAREVALVADQNFAVSDSLEFGQWSGDVGLHFLMSSSLGNKGRIVFETIRIMRTERCLELGTAYGMSGLFILEALKMYTRSGRLTTVEGSERQFSLSSPMLERRYGSAVSCHLGWTNVVLPKLVKSLGPIDFMFHDAAHTREDYVRDFNQVVDLLVPGATVVFDDIRWTPSFPMPGGDPETYKGWTEVVAHPRVGRAVEIDGMLGLLLMR
jgi:predicted O-methyltransferase YrrM